MVKQLKNRYNDPTANKRFALGIDRNKMRLYDCNDQSDIIDANQTKEQVEAGDILAILPETKTSFKDFKV